MTAPHDAPDAVEAMAEAWSQGQFYTAAAMLRRLHARAVAAERERDDHKSDARAAIAAKHKAMDALATARADALREAAAIARMAHMVPPDGGSPTPEECAVADAAERHILALIHPTTTCDTAAFLARIQAAAEAGEPVTADDVARLRRMADWADAPPPPGWNGTLDRGEAARAVKAARERMRG